VFDLNCISGRCLQLDRRLAAIAGPSGGLEVASSVRKLIQEMAVTSDGEHRMVILELLLVRAAASLKPAFCAGNHCRWIWFQPLADISHEQLYRRSALMIILA